jgi:hypothetical protein
MSDYHVFEDIRVYEELKIKAKQWGLELRLMQDNKMAVLINNILIGSYSTIEAVSEVVEVIEIFIKNNNSGKYTCLIVPRGEKSPFPDSILSTTDLVLETNCSDIRVVKDRSGQLKVGNYVYGDQRPLGEVK